MNENVLKLHNLINLKKLESKLPSARWGQSMLLV